MRSPAISIYGRALQRSLKPPPNHAATVIADWITAKEEHEIECTIASFIRYQAATTVLLNDDEARSVFIHLLKARRSNTLE